VPEVGRKIADACREPLRDRTLGGMARVRRRDLPDGYFQITANAVHETVLFRTDRDRRLFLLLFLAAMPRFGLTLHAYCLMDTHYHAVLEGTTEQLSRAVQWFQSHYAREHNARHERKGALFRERFSSWVIDTQEYLENTIAYVLANPVRAGLVDRPEDWPWSWSRKRRKPTNRTLVRSHPHG
jgi:putative transposase